MIGDGVTGFAVQNIIQTGLRPALIAYALEEKQRIGNAPAGIGIHPDKTFVGGWNLIGVAVPFQKTFFKKMSVIQKRKLKMDARTNNGVAARFSETGDDYLLSFVHHKGSGKNNNE